MRAVDQRLSVLTCRGCDAPIALARDARVRCPFCGAEVEIPETYRAALDVTEREVAADALTHQAFATLGTPPSALLRALAAITGGAGRVVLTTILTFVLVVHAFNWAIAHGSAWLHVNLYDFLSHAEQELVVFGGSFVALGAIFALAVFGRRRALDLGGLQRALAAHPPAREGGPARCRDCGAPLTVPRDALGVRCAYCQCDNLVALPDGWLARAKGEVRRVAHEAKSLLGRHRFETRRLRLRLALRLGVLALLAALVLTSTVRRIFAGGGAFDLRAALAATPRLLFDAQAHAVSLPPPGPAAPDVLIDQCAGKHPVAHDQAGWFVAMRKGETLTLAPEATGTARWFEHNQDTGWTQALGRAEGWGTERAAAPVATGKPARFTAAVTSWHRVTLELHDAGAGFDVCAALR